MTPKGYHNGAMGFPSCLLPRVRKEDVEWPAPKPKPETEKKP